MVFVYGSRVLQRLLAAIAHFRGFQLAVVAVIALAIAADQDLQLVFAVWATHSLRLLAGVVYYERGLAVWAIQLILANFEVVIFAGYVRALDEPIISRVRARLQHRVLAAIRTKVNLIKGKYILSQAISARNRLADAEFLLARNDLLIADRAD